MRALKIIGIVIGVLAALLILGGIAIVWLVDPNDYRDDIEQLVERQTGRSLGIGGNLDLKVFPWLAITIDDVTLGNPPGYGPEPFATVRRASVGVKLLPLLRSRRLEVSRIGVEELTVRLVSRGEDENNWKDLGAEEESAEPAGGEAPGLHIAGIDVTRSSVVYIDEAEGSTTRLTGLEMHTGPLLSGEPVRATLAFDYDDGGGRPLAHVEMSTLVRLSQGQSRLELADLDITGRWLGDPAGEADDGRSEGLPFSVHAAAMELDWEAGTLAPTELDVRVADLPVRLSVAGEQLLSEPVVTGRITVPEVSPRKFLPSFGVDPPTTSDPAALTRLAFEGDYRLTGKALRLANLALSLDDTRVSGSAAIEDLERMALVFDLGVDAIDVDRYLEPESGVDQGGASAGGGSAEEESVELPVDALRELDARGTLRIGRARFTGLDFTDVHLPLQAKGGLVRLGPTRAGLFGGAYNGDITLDVRPEQARLSLNEHVRGIDLGALMKAAFETDRVMGRGDASAVLNARGNTTAAWFETLAGKIQADVKEGALMGVDLWYELRRARALLERKPVPVREGPVRTAFSTLRGSAVLEGGVMRSDDLRVETDYLRARGEGTLNLSTGAVDYRLVTLVYEVPVDGAGSELADLKSLEVPITITGTLDDMKVRPDVESVVKARVRQEVTEKVQEKTQEIKKKLGDKLKDLLGR